MDVFRRFDSFSESAENLYVLALAVARRVRSLKDGAPPLVDVENGRARPMETAAQEFSEQRITFSPLDGAGGGAEDRAGG